VVLATTSSKNWTAKRSQNDLSLLQFHSKTFLKSGDRSGLEPSLRWLQAPTENRGSCCLPTRVRKGRKGQSQGSRRSAGGRPRYHLSRVRSESASPFQSMKFPSQSPAGSGKQSCPAICGAGRNARRQIIGTDPDVPFRDGATVSLQQLRLPVCNRRQPWLGGLLRGVQYQQKPCGE
jgi:hypothetical protein